ncbi:hypothetical protein [Butyrivibrio sp. WCD3002]|nr:hypothetical protein [Butyrivibrio sp. WCD3002]
MTVDTILVRMAQLNKRKMVLDKMRKLFGAMDERTRQIMLVQMRAVARF